MNDDVLQQLANDALADYWREIDMEQTTMNRGHLAFIEDQAHAAAAAFRDGQLADVEVILESVASYITAQLAKWRAGK